MTAEEGHDGAQYLAGSPVRVAILRALREEPQRPAALTDAVDATRTTVQRILGGFRERDWVVKRDGDYRVTPTGERVHDAYETLLTEVDRAERYGRFAETVERVGVDFPAEGIPDSDLTVASDQNPLAVVDRLTELLRESRGGDIRAVSPVVLQQFNDAAAAALDDGASVELIIDRDVADASVAEFEPATDRALDDDDAEVYVSAESIEYGLFRCGDVACVAAYDERNNPRCVLESSEETVVGWVDDAFASLRDEATRLSSIVERA